MDISPEADLEKSGLPCQHGARWDGRVPSDKRHLGALMAEDQDLVRKAPQPV